MRRLGPSGHAAASGPEAHACWCYDEVAEFLEVAIPFLGDGLALGQRLVYLAPGPPAEARRDLAMLGDVDGLVRSGTLVVGQLGALGDPTVGVGTTGLLARCHRLVDRAIADGFTGLRFAGDVTPLTAPPRSCAEQVRWEQSFDAFLAGHAMAALCGYDRALIGAEAAAALTGAHPLRLRAAPTFGVSTLAGALHLEGEVDAFQVDELRSLLDSAPIDTDEAVLDVGNLSFVDCAGIGAIARWVGEQHEARRRPVIRGAPYHFARLWDLLGHATVIPLETGGRRSGLIGAVPGPHP